MERSRGSTGVVVSFYSLSRELSLESLPLFEFDNEFSRSNSGALTR